MSAFLFKGQSAGDDLRTEIHRRQKNSFNIHSIPSITYAWNRKCSKDIFIPDVTPAPFQWISFVFI